MSEQQKQPEQSNSHLAVDDGWHRLAHTQGELVVDAQPGEYLLRVKSAIWGLDGYIAGLPIGGPTRRANAARMALCWNAHDKLVAALREVLDLCAAGDVDENTEALGWGDAIKFARAALSKATGT